MQPHMHLRGKDMTYVATYPDGREEMLLSVPKYDFNWQNTYMPTKPVKLPAGTVLEDRRPLRQLGAPTVNPQPNRPALWSEQTWDEMYNAWTEITYDARDRIASLNAAAVARAQQAALEEQPDHDRRRLRGAGTVACKWTMTSAREARLPAACPPAQRAARGDAWPARVSAQHHEGRDGRGREAVEPAPTRFELVGVSDFVTPRAVARRIRSRKALYPLERVNATGALAPDRRVAAKGVWIPGSPTRINLTSVVRARTRAAACRRRTTSSPIIPYGASAESVRRGPVTSQRKTPCDLRCVSRLPSGFVLAVQLASRISRRSSPAIPVADGGVKPAVGRCLTAEQRKVNDDYNALNRPTRPDDEMPFWDPEYFVGTWDFDMRTQESPLGPGGPSIGTLTIKANARTAASTKAR